MQVGRVPDVARFEATGNGPQYRVWDNKRDMYLTPADISLTVVEAEEICATLNGRAELDTVSRATRRIK